MIIEDNYNDLALNLKDLTDIDIHVCYQCGKCSAGCSTAGYMDLLPNQIVHHAQLGNSRKILTSNAIWTCVSCGICTSRCPKNIDILRLIDFFRAQAYKEGLYPHHSGPGIFYKLFLDNIARHGKLSEWEIGAMYNLYTGHFIKDIELLPGLVATGKLKLLPEKIKDRDYIKNLLKTIEAVES